MSCDIIAQKMFRKYSELAWHMA